MGVGLSVLGVAQPGVGGDTGAAFVFAEDFPGSFLALCAVFSARKWLGFLRPGAGARQAAAVCRARCPQSPAGIPVDGIPPEAQPFLSPLHDPLREHPPGPPRFNEECRAVLVPASRRRFATLDHIYRQASAVDYAGGV